MKLRSSVRLREVRTAVRRMDAGTFGICAGCEEEINPKRLTAVPWASCCTVCQEAADRGQEMPGSQIHVSFDNPGFGIAGLENARLAMVA